MFCSLYAGPAPGPWRDAVREHAAWLGLDVTAETRRLATGAALEVAWFHPREVSPPGLADAGDWVLVSPFGEWPPDLLAARDRGTLQAAASRRADNVVTIAVHRTRAEILAVVPLASPHPLLFGSAAGGSVLGDDLRLFRRLTPAHLDERGLYALAQFGAIPAPLTVFREVHRVPNGHGVRLEVGSIAPEVAPLHRATAPAPPRAGAPDAASAAARVEHELEAVLARVPRPAALCFSGGVDSGLLGAQLARLGRRDVPVFNYAFGPDDPESALAARMAARLGLELHRICYNGRAAGEVIERIGRDYTFPFGDISVVPTNILVRQAAAMTPPGGTALEGTGADGAYALGATYPWWRAVYALPHALRYAVSAAYGVTRLWRRASRLIYVLRFIRKSASMPLTHAVVAQHALDGIALRSTPSVRREVAETARTFIEGLVTGLEPAERLSLVDLMWVCAGRMAPKSFDPLRHAGIMPRYPYLEPPMVAVGTSIPWAVKCAGGEPKAPLKTLLARHVPPDWVYRTKHGFTPPEQEILSTPAAQERLHSTVLAPGGPFAGLCRADRIRAMAALVRGGPVSSSIFDFLWVLLFTSTWLDQVPTGNGLGSGEPLPAAPAVEAV